MTEDAIAGILVFVIWLVIISIAIYLTKKNGNTNKTNTNKKYEKFKVDGSNDTLESRHSDVCRHKHTNYTGNLICHITGKYMDINQRTGENLYFVEYVLESINIDKTYTKKISREKYCSLKIGDDVTYIGFNKF